MDGEPATPQPTARRGSRGASLVEFALLCPVLFALLLGMITGGMALSQKNSMQNAAREGARLGATLEESATWASSVQTRVVNLAGGDLTASQVCAELVMRTTSGETTRKATACTLPASAEPSSSSIPVGQCAVKVWAQRQSDLEVIFFSRPLTLEAQSINRFERPCT